MPEIPYAYCKYWEILDHNSETGSGILIRRQHPLEEPDKSIELDRNLQEPVIQEANIPSETALEDQLDTDIASYHANRLCNGIQDETHTAATPVELVGPALESQEHPVNKESESSVPATIFGVTESGTVLDFSCNNIQIPIIPPPNATSTDLSRTITSGQHATNGPSTPPNTPVHENLVPHPVDEVKATFDIDNYMPGKDQPLICGFPGCTQGGEITPCLWICIYSKHSLSVCQKRWSQTTYTGFTRWRTKCVSSPALLFLNRF
jgi:hypothetical protein